MIVRYALAPVRGLVLFAIALAGPVALLVMLLASITSATGVLRVVRALPDLARRLAGGWSGVEIATPDRPPAPEREPDGWYRHGTTLYRTEREAVANSLFEDRDDLWLLLNPFVGGPLAVAPAALIGLGIATPGWFTVAAVVLGVGLAPQVLRLHGEWTRLLLSPGRRSRTGWFAGRAVALKRLGVTGGLSVAGFALGLVTVVGFWARVLPAVRSFVDARRRQVRVWTGVEISRPYLPEPSPPPRRPDGTYRVGERLYESRREARRAQQAKDPATRRDLGWLLLDPLVAAVLVVPALVAGYGSVLVLSVWVWVWPARLFSEFDPWASWWEVLGVLPVGVEFGLTLVLPFVALAAAPWLLRLHGRWSRSLLAPTRLASRVEQLDRSRTDASDTQAAELRRIERDLHDGTQARWVALGMKLGAVEHLIDTDPAAAKEHVARLRADAAGALTELRDLVRGIHPPVLAERGLADAVRAVALDSPLRVDVHADLPVALNRPVETAAYFAVCELLTNVGKHADASHVAIDLRHADGYLTIEVADDGRGGADPRAGSGLRGIQRRLAPFDGTMSLRSNDNGTTVTLEVPHPSDAAQDVE